MELLPEVAQRVGPERLGREAQTRAGCRGHQSAASRGDVTTRRDPRARARVRTSFARNVDAVGNSSQCAPKIVTTRSGRRPLLRFDDDCETTRGRSGGDEACAAQALIAAMAALARSATSSGATSSMWV